MRKRPIRAFVALAVTLGWLTVSSASAGTLVEAQVNGLPLRIEAGSSQTPTDVVLNGDAYTTEPERSRSLGGNSSDFTLKEYGPGPIVAGHISRYAILFRGDEICGEILFSPWMTPFLEPAVHAIAALQDTDPRLALVLEPSCGPVPFAILASAGWPLLAASKTQEPFRTLQVRFDFQRAR
ncbi:MAG: hypothetical protein AAFY56_05265 [Pseudomonadota bacterium]